MASNFLLLGKSYPSQNQVKYWNSFILQESKPWTLFCMQCPQYNVNLVQYLVQEWAAWRRRHQAAPLWSEQARSHLLKKLK